MALTEYQGVGAHLPDKDLPDINDRHQTPWGPLYWIGPGHMWQPGGWMPGKTKLMREGKLVEGKLLPSLEKKMEEEKTKMNEVEKKEDGK